MSDMSWSSVSTVLALHNFGRGMTATDVIPMFTPMLCETLLRFRHMAHESGPGYAIEQETWRAITAWLPANFFTAENRPMLRELCTATRSNGDIARETTERRAAR